MSEHTTVMPEHQPQPAPRRSRGGLIAIVASVVAVVVIAGGGFAAWQFFAGGGPRPAEVLPASTFALLSVDLDPSGGQKVEAIKTLRKFPTFREESGLKPDSDPIKRLFEEIQEAGQCKDLDYDRDIKSWIGQRAGLGGVLLDGKPAPVAALQVSDTANAKTGFARLAKCAELEGDDFGWTLSEDYIVISDSTAHAKELAAAGKKAPLSEDEDFQKWTEEAGGVGIVNAYAGPQTIDVLSEELSSGLEEDLGLGDDDLSGSDDEAMADALAAYKDFQGAAAVLHFADGGIELSVAGGGGKAVKGAHTVSEHVDAMPSDTALLLALAIPEGAFDALEKADPDAMGSELLGGMLGIDFPEDLKTLLGTSLSISVGGDAPDDLSTIQEPGDVSIGALINGDAEKIDAVIAKLEQRAGASLDDLDITKSSKDGKVVLASNQKYADELLGSGSLSDDEGFQDAVPNADDAQMVAYVDFDGDWGKAILDLIREDGDPESEEIADNLEALRGFGASVWTEGDVSHGLVRLSMK